MAECAILIHINYYIIKPFFKFLSYIFLDLLSFDLHKTWQNDNLIHHKTKIKVFAKHKI